MRFALSWPGLKDTLQYLVIADDDVYINLPGLAKSLGQGKKEASKIFFILGFKLFLNSSNLFFMTFRTLNIWRVMS